MSRRRHYRACHLCEAICGLVIETEGEHILSIKGDKHDPLSRGHICPKAVALKDIHEDPDRLRRPLKKVVGPAGERHLGRRSAGRRRWTPPPGAWWRSHSATASTPSASTWAIPPCTTTA